MMNNLIRAPRGAVSIALAAGVALLAAGSAPAQTVIYSANGFENPPFTTGPLASYYIPPFGFQGGQQAWQTTDPNAASSATPVANHAGQIVANTPFAGTQSFQVLGNRLQNDPAFSGQTFWFRSAAPGAISPVASGTPLVTMSTQQNVTGTTPVNINDMPFVGLYMEGHPASGPQNTITSVLRNINGGITVLGPAGSSFSTADNIWSPNTYHNLQVLLDFNPGAQNLTVLLDGVQQTFTPSGGGASQTVLPFRNTGMVSIAEYGFQASFNTNTGLPASNNAFFDNFTLTRAVPEPASILLICAGTAAAGWRFRRRKVA
jgi:hypothetical protein